MPSEWNRAVFDPILVHWSTPFGAPGEKSPQKTVQKPEGFTVEQWLTIHAIDAYTDAFGLFSAIKDEKCNATSCPTMSAGTSFEYRWRTEDSQTAVILPAANHMRKMFRWAQKTLIDNLEMGRTNSEGKVEFAEGYKATLRLLFKRVFRVYCHLYHSHFHHLDMLGLNRNMESCFSMLVHVIDKFKLVEANELEPLAGQILRCCEDLEHIRISSPFKEVPKKLAHAHSHALASKERPATQVERVSRPSIFKGKLRNLSKKLTSLIQPFHEIDTERVKYYVDRPPDQDIDDWLTAHVVQLIELTVILFEDTISAHCTDQTCPIMRAGPKYQYNWSDRQMLGGKEGSEEVSAAEYLRRYIIWSEALLSEALPPDAYTPFPKDYQEILSLLCTRLFRVYVHIFHEHYDEISGEGQGYSAFRYLEYLLVLTHSNDLIKEREWEPIRTIVEKVLKLSDSNDVRALILS